MKLRVMVMNFEKPLTTEQEIILISYFKALPEDIVKGIMEWHRKTTRAGKLASRLPLIGRGMKDKGELLANLAEFYSGEITRYTLLTRPAPTKYEFCYPQKLKHFVLISNDHTLLNLFNEAMDKMGKPAVKSVSFEERETA